MSKIKEFSTAAFTRKQLLEDMIEEILYRCGSLDGVSVLQDEFMIKKGDKEIRIIPGSVVTFFVAGNKKYKCADTTSAVKHLLAGDFVHKSGCLAKWFMLHPEDFTYFVSIDVASQPHFTSEQSQAAVFSSKDSAKIVADKLGIRCLLERA